MIVVTDGVHILFHFNILHLYIDSPEEQHFFCRVPRIGLLLFGEECDWRWKRRRFELKRDCHEAGK